MPTTEIEDANATAPGTRDAQRGEFDVAWANSAAEIERAMPAWLQFLERGASGQNVHNDPRMVLLSLERQPSLRPRIMLISQGGQLVCVAPFYEEDRRFSFEFSVWNVTSLRSRALRVFGESIVVANDAFTDACVAQVGKALRTEFAQIDYFQVYGLNHSERFWAAALASKAFAKLSGWKLVTMRQEKNHQLRLKSSLDAFLMELSSETRRMIRRHRRKFFSDPAARLVKISQAGDVPQLIEWMGRVYQDSWQAKTFGVVAEAAELERAQLERIAQLGWLRSYVLLLGEEPVAFKHSFQYSGTLYSHGTAYRQQYSANSPGIVLTFCMLEDLHADHAVSMWDFGFGDLQYKRTFCNQAHDTAIVYFVPRNRWRLIMKAQTMLNFSYDRLRSLMVRLKIDRFVRKIVKRQQ